MYRCTPSLMESYFERFGWSYTCYPFSTWRTWGDDINGDHNVIINITGSSILFQIDPFVKDDLDWNLWPEVIKELKKWEVHLPIIKITVGEAGDLRLSTVAMVENFSFDNFKNIIELLVEIATDLRHDTPQIILFQ